MKYHFNRNAFSPTKKFKATAYSMGLKEIESSTIESCVYRLYYGDKYIIQKGKNLSGSLFLIQKGLAYFLAYDHKEYEGQNRYFFQFYNHVRSNPGLKFRVEVLFESTNGYQLLKREQIELNESFSDKKCLNNNISAYIPQRKVKGGDFGWISRYHVAAFRRFQKHYC